VLSCLRNGGIVNIDSRRDLQLVLQAAESLKNIGRVGVRCNFALTEGSSSRFGIDINDDLFTRAIKSITESSSLRLCGLHCHFPDRNLSSFASRCDGILALVKRIPGFVPEFINIGGGFYGTIPASLRSRVAGEPPVFEDYARTIAGRFSLEFSSCKHQPELIVEPGTALVADTFEFFTKVIDVKSIRGRIIATTAGSIFNISPSARVTELPFTILRSPSSTTGSGEARFDVVGFTCIEGDCMSQSVPGSISPGDFICYKNVGSYSIVMKPPFILPNYALLELESSGNHRLIKKKEDFNSIFHGFTDLPCD